MIIVPKHHGGVIQYLTYLPFICICLNCFSVVGRGSTNIRQRVCGVEQRSKYDLKENLFTSSKIICPEAWWARIFKLLWSPEIDSKEPIPPTYVAWRAGTITLFLFGSSPHRLFKNISTFSPHHPIFTSWYEDISFEDYVTFILLLDVSFMGEAYSNGGKMHDYLDYWFHGDYLQQGKIVYHIAAREDWIIYRGPSFLAVVWFGSLHTHAPPYSYSRQQIASLSQSSCVSSVELTNGRGGRGGRGAQSYDQ